MRSAVTRVLRAGVSASLSQVARARKGARYRRSANALDMREETPAVVDAFIDAAAALMAMPLDAQRRAAVVTNMLRIAAFGAQLAALELADDIEPAGDFVP